MQKHEAMFILLLISLTVSASLASESASLYIFVKLHLSLIFHSICKQHFNS